MAVETPVAPSAPSSASSLAGPPPHPAPLALDLPSLRRREHPPCPRALVLVDPDGAFAATLRRPMALVCVVVAAAFSLLPPIAFFVSAERSGGVAVVLVDEMRKSGRLDRIPPEARAKALEVIVPGTLVALPVGAVVKRSLWILGCAGLCFVFLRGSRSGLRFAPLVACAAVGAAPSFLHDVISALAMLTHDLRALDPQNPVASNPSAILFSGASSRSALAVLLRGLDVFDLWACAWMAAGLDRAVGGRTHVPVVVVFGLHVAGVLIEAARVAAQAPSP